MTVKPKFSLQGAGRDSYLELVTTFPLASVKSDEQLQEAQKVMDQLLARGKVGDGEECTSMRSATSLPPTRTNTMPFTRACSSVLT